MTEKLKWTVKSFDNLSNSELYAILQLRSDVFVVEQNCVYRDLDGKDAKCLHVMGQLSSNGLLVASTRIVPPTISYEEPAIGRVVTAAAYRKYGYGIELMQKSIDVISELYPGENIRIGAQTYLRRFYNSLGFEEVGSVYDEDGIEHVEMLREAST